MPTTSAKHRRKRTTTGSRRTKSDLGSVLARIAEFHDLRMDRDSAAGVASCGFYGDNLELAVVAADVLLVEQPITLRGLMYRLVSTGWLPSTDAVHYKRLGRIMTRLREAGAVPFAWIVDGVRATDKPSSWSGLGDYAASVAECYRRDFWARLPHYVHIVCEKDAVSATLAPVTREYDVALSPIRGYVSVSFAAEIAAEFARIEKPIFLYFVGDYDASGFDIERDFREKLGRYCNKRVWDATGNDFGWWRRSVEQVGGVMFRRVAVVASDFDEFDLLPLSVKNSDARARKFRELYGDRCAELDALPSTELRRRVRELIEWHVGQRRDEWERLQAVECAERETLNQFVASMKGGAA